MYVHNIDNGEYILIRGVDFGRKGAKKILASIGSDGIGCMEIHLDSPDGPMPALIAVTPTGGRLVFKTFSRKFKRRVRDVHDLYFVFTGADKDMFTFDWWRCKK